MKLNYDEVKEVLKKYGQEHIITCYESLSEEGKATLLKQLETLDFV